jgi:O-phospho-L-seryl-tRNASec:L-selenocysteinyl-tRNA synthase
VVTNIALLNQKIEELGAENILCVLPTTSCFAPRVPDKIEEIAKICKEKDIFHVINNAYGL